MVLSAAAVSECLRQERQTPHAPLLTAYPACPIRLFSVCCLSGKHRFRSTPDVELSGFWGKLRIIVTGKPFLLWFAALFFLKKPVMKKVFPVLLAVLTFVISGYSIVSAAVAPDRIAAIVGREIILDSQLDEQALMYRLQNPEAKSDPDIRKRLLESLITQKILLTKAKIDSVSVDEKSIDDMAATRYRNLRAGFASVRDMEARFSLPVNRLKQDIREDIRNQQLVDAFRRQHFHDVTVSYEETMAFYEKEKGALPEFPEMISFSQIVKYSEISDAEKKKAFEKIRSIQAQLQGGADFARLARQYSDDPGSRPAGGDLGFNQRGAMVPGFEKAAWVLKPGQVSEIVETRFGYHLIQLIDKEEYRIHTRHILAMFDRSKADYPGTIRKLQAVRADILSGKAEFGDMARKYSDDPAAARSGGLFISSATGEGDIEYLSLRPDLQKIVNELQKPGDISQPVKFQPENSEPVFIMVRLNSRTPSHPLSPEHDFLKLEELAANRKRQELFNAWIETLKKEVYVQVMSDI